VRKGALPVFSRCWFRVRSVRPQSRTRPPGRSRRNWFAVAATVSNNDMASCRSLVCELGVLMLSHCWLCRGVWCWCCRCWWFMTRESWCVIVDGFASGYQVYNGRISSTLCYQITVAHRHKHEPGWKRVPTGNWKTSNRGCRWNWWAVPALVGLMCMNQAWGKTITCQQHDISGRDQSSKRSTSSIIENADCIYFTQNSIYSKESHRKFGSIPTCRLYDSFPYECEKNSGAYKQTE